MEDLQSNDILEVTENVHIVPDEQMMGSSGMRRVDVKCVGPTMQAVRMAYVKSWEWKGFEEVVDGSDANGNKTHTVNVLCLENDKADLEQINDEL